MSRVVVVVVVVLILLQSLLLEAKAFLIDTDLVEDVVEKVHLIYRIYICLYQRGPSDQAKLAAKKFEAAAKIRTPFRDDVLENFKKSSFEGRLSLPHRRA